MHQVSSFGYLYGNGLVGCAQRKGVQWRRGKGIPIAVHAAAMVLGNKKRFVGACKRFLK